MAAKTAPKKAENESFLQSQMPVYLGVLLLILGLVAGGVLAGILLPPKQSPVTQNNLEYVFLSHPDCKICALESAFSLLLERNDVTGVKRSVDATSAEGQQLIVEYNIDSFPAVIVNAQNFRNASVPLFATLQVSFPIQNGVLVMQERDLAVQTNLRTNYMVAQPVTQCTVKQNRATVWEFGDLMAPDLLGALQPVLSLQQDLNSQLDFDFKYLYVPGQYNEFVAYSLGCAQEQGKLTEYMVETLHARHLQGLPVWNLDLQADLAQKAGIADLNSFRQCVVNQKYKDRFSPTTGTDRQLTQELGLLSTPPRVPQFVLDCQFVIGDAANLDQYVCDQRFDLSACGNK